MGMVCPINNSLFDHKAGIFIVYASITSLCHEENTICIVNHVHNISHVCNLHSLGTVQGLHHAKLVIFEPPTPDHHAMSHLFRRLPCIVPCLEQAPH